MTTKEEVLQLAKDAGFRIDCADIIEFNVDWDGCAMEITDEITKLIELAKAQGAAEEREACANLCDSLDNGMHGRLGSVRYIAHEIRARKDK